MFYVKVSLLVGICLLYLELSRGYLRQWRRIQINGLEFENYEVELSDFELKAKEQR